MSWRILTYYEQENLLYRLSDSQLAHARQALRIWGSFLMEERSDPGPYEQHMVALDLVSSHTMPSLSPFFNRYVTRSIDFDVASNGNRACVFTKMCRIINIGWLAELERQCWQGTTVAPTIGELSPGSVQLPGVFFKLIDCRASETARAFSRLSTRQRERIEREMLGKPDSIAAAKIFDAMEADVRLSGASAFRITAEDDGGPAES
jgi:hypothetical protein